jgi:hypothetical protein
MARYNGARLRPQLGVFGNCADYQRKVRMLVAIAYIMWREVHYGVERVCSETFYYKRHHHGLIDFALSRRDQKSEARDKSPIQAFCIDNLNRSESLVVVP